MERISHLDVKPCNLDTEDRPWATLINVIINGAAVQVYYVNILTSYFSTHTRGILTAFSGK